MKFEWDDAKNRANQRKHGLSFEEAQQLFESGDDYLEIFDESHSSLEDRFIAIGEIRRGVALIVYTERNGERDPHYRCTFRYQAREDALFTAQR